MKKKAKKECRKTAKKSKSQKQTFFSRNSGWFVAGFIFLLTLIILVYKSDISGNITLNPASSTSGEICLCDPCCKLPQTCQNGHCVDSCTPANCTSLGKNCGPWPNGCGGTLNCGTCTLPLTCQNGQCTSSCTDECSPSGARQCYLSPHNFRVCGNYDSDSCLEWPTDSISTCPTSIPHCNGGNCVQCLNNGDCIYPQTCNAVGQCVSGTTYTCSETDGGNKNDTAGNLTIRVNGIIEIQEEDHCSIYGLVEYYCNSSAPQGALVQIYNCNAEGKVCLFNSRGEGYCGIVGCVPATCTSLGKNCESWPNGCGGTLNCGTCGTGETCSNGQCVSVSPGIVIAEYKFEKDRIDDQGGTGSLSSTRTLNSDDYSKIGTCDNYFIETQAGNATSANPLVLYKSGVDSDKFGREEPFSVSLWVRIDADENGAYSDIVSKYENYRISARDGSLQFAVKDSNDDWKEIDAEASSGEWMFVAAVYDGIDIYLYINGEEVGTENVDALAAPPLGKSFVIFANQGNGGTTTSSFLRNCNTSSGLDKSECIFHGAIDELVVWNLSLDTDQIYSLYTESDPYGYEEGSNYFFDCETSETGSFTLGVLVCADSICSEESDSFDKGSKVYFDFTLENDSEGADLDDETELSDFASDVSVRATISFPGGTNQTISLPGSLTLTKLGTYRIKAISTKPGYYQKTATASFVIKNAEETSEPPLTEEPPAECNDNGMCEPSEGETSENCPGDCPKSSDMFIIWIIIALVSLILITAGILAYVFYRKKKEKTKKKEPDNLEI
jgi:hypothetical protein